MVWLKIPIYNQILKKSRKRSLVHSDYKIPKLYDSQKIYNSKSFLKLIVNKLVLLLVEVTSKYGASVWFTQNVHNCYQIAKDQ